MSDLYALLGELLERLTGDPVVAIPFFWLVAIAIVLLGVRLRPERKKLRIDPMGEDDTDATWLPPAESAAARRSRAH